MYIKSYIDPESLREFIIKKAREIQGEVTLFETLKSGESGVLPDGDDIFDFGKFQGRVEAASEVLRELLEIIKE